MHPLEIYFDHVRRVRASGAAQDETSYYGAIEALFTSYGQKLKPKVFCIMQLRNSGAGMPDGGFLTADQYRRGDTTAPLRGQIPARGVIEAKAPSANVENISGTAQVQGYVDRYGVVLVTNLREFLLVGRSPTGTVVPVDAPYSIAATEAAFWERIQHPRTLAEQCAPTFDEFAIRVLLNKAPLGTPSDLARLMASYAREAKIRVEEHADHPSLRTLQTAFEEALGMTFRDDKGLRFFRSSLVQTLLYGLFSAWVLWARQPNRREQTFRWHDALWNLHVPMIRVLFAQLATPMALNPLGLLEIMDWSADALNRVDQAAFFESFDTGDAVQYFYEPFLEEFDPELRKQLGVWYTPREIVRYMVRRIDAVLRESLGVTDGLANPNVYVLDPCCGTGAYLVEVIQVINETLKAQGQDALHAHELKQAALGRVFGFEILAAPFVVSHLQLGLLLKSLGAPLDDSRQERPSVFLTNALTGWRPPQGPKQRLIFAEMEEERDRADEVKQQRPILVILGNPPYDGFAGIAVGEERELSDAYRTVHRVAAPEGQGLNELYVRFFRAAERKIAEQTNRGIVCFISNYSWLDSRSCTGMRERYLEVFDKIFIDNLHGDRIISEYAPDGRASETVFAIRGTSPGIKVGTAITLLLKRSEQPEGAEVLYRDFEMSHASDRRAALLSALESQQPTYMPLRPELALGLPLKPRALSSTYVNWPLLPELFPKSFPGIQPGREDLVVDIDRKRLTERMESYFDPDVTDSRIAELAPRAMETTARFDATATRVHLISRGFLRNNIFPFSYRPFDNRWLYWEPETKLIDEKRADYVPNVGNHNIWLAAAQKVRRAFDPPVVTRLHASRHVIERGANLFPMFVRSEQGQLGENVAHLPEFRPNVSDELLEWGRNASVATFDTVFFHAVAVLYSKSYRVENAGALLQDWPRIPLPNSGEVLQQSARLGRLVADLVDPETAVEGVTINPSACFSSLARIVTVDENQIEASRDLFVSRNWGYFGPRAAVMAATGDARTREYTARELEQIHSDPRTIDIANATVDVYLNDNVYFANIPSEVWEYTIGGYEVLRKWLSYRDSRVLGRAINPSEARLFASIARRIFALLLIEPELDQNYERLKETCPAWPPQPRNG